VLIEGLGSWAGGLRRKHGRLLVVWMESCSHGATALRIDVCTEGAEVVEELVDLLLERVYMRRHLLELVRLLEIVATIWRILAVKVEVTTSLTRCLAIALDFASLTLIAGTRQPSHQERNGKTLPSNRDISISLGPTISRSQCLSRTRSDVEITYGCGALSSLLRLLLGSLGGLIVSLALFLDVALMINSAVRAIVPLPDRSGNGFRL
jgi:hypothetical protein